MFILKYTGASFDYFFKGESYIARITKKGHTYAFNEKGFWSQVKRTDFANNRLAKFFEVEKEFYVYGYKAAMNYATDVVKENWGVDFKKIVKDGAKFTFIRPDVEVEEYTGVFVLNDNNEVIDLKIMYFDPSLDCIEIKFYTDSLPYSTTGDKIINWTLNEIISGSWIITSIKDN